MLENHTEALVRDVLKEYRMKETICECPRCEEDIVAMVLNQLPPKYFLSDAEEGDKIAYQLNQRLRFEALIKITEAANQVMERNHPASG